MIWKFEDYGNYPKQFWIDTPRGRNCTIGNDAIGIQTFSTDDLPSSLIATFDCLETTKVFFREISLLKYHVEPIFSLRMNSKEDRNGNEYYDYECICKLCKLISQPWMRTVRSATLQDGFIQEDRGEKPYWLYTPNDKYHLSFVQNGNVCRTSVIGCEGGYYYEFCKTENDTQIRKVSNKDQLLKEPKEVKPVIFLDAMAFVKLQEMKLAIA